MLETVAQDVRHGARMLIKNPAFSLVAILSIAIGVGANAAMFSITDGLILRPLPVPEPDQLVVVRLTTPTGDVRNSVSYPDYADLRDRVRSLDGIAAARGVVTSFVRNGEEPAQSRFGVAVSARFFDVLHIRPSLGRTFAADEDRAGSRHAVVVLAHETWTEQFGSDPGIVGREIHLTGEPFTVIGVAPEGFTGTDLFIPAAFYVPITMLPALDPAVARDILERRGVQAVRVIGRLKPGASVDQARQEVDIVSRALQQEHPDTNQRQGLVLQGEMDARLSDYSLLAGLSAILIALAIAVLLVACANVAGLLTSRGPARAREIAVRLAIGGSRVRLVRQLITESALIAAAGGVVGLALGYAGIRSFQQFQMVTDIGVRLTYVLDRRALLVGLIVAALSALLSSAIPAWRSTRLRDLSGTLRNTTTPAARAARLWGRHGLVASQIALTLVVLTVATAFYRAFNAEYGAGPGFRTDHIVLTSLDPALARYDQGRSDAFYRLLKDRISAAPWVSSVALTSFVPFSQDGGDASAIVPEAFELPPGATSLTVAAARVDEGYLSTMGIAIVSGRGILATDTADSPRVAVVTRGMAQRYWPGADPLGKRIRMMNAGGAWAEIVGVAADAKFRIFTPSSTPFLYLPRLQNPSTRSTLVVRTQTASADAAALVRTAIGDTDRSVPILGMRTMETFYDANTKNLNRVVVRTIAAMGIMGLTLALVGLYGLMAYAVGRRTREIGIRMAIGALPGSVLGMVLRQGSVPAFGGVAIGVLASIAADRFTRAVFAGTGADLITFLIVVPAVAALVMLAAYIPARRAAHIDPLLALRQE